MIKAYNFSAFGQGLLDTAIKVGSYVLVLALNYIIAGLSNGSIQLPGGTSGALLGGAIALGLSQFDTYFVAWTQKNNIPVPPQA